MLPVFNSLLFVIDYPLPRGSISVRRRGVGLSDYSTSSVAQEFICAVENFMTQKNMSKSAIFFIVFILNFNGLGHLCNSNLP
jgi:hypothetical protein